jgi:hypothetical protein
MHRPSKYLALLALLSMALGACHDDEKERTCAEGGRLYQEGSFGPAPMAAITVIAWMVG